MENKQLWIIVLAVLLAFFLLGIFGMMPFGGYGMMGMMGDYWTGGAFMGFFMLVIWVLIIIALILGIIWLTKQNQEK